MVISKDMVLRWIEQSAIVLEEKKEHLTTLDAAIGDADHGSNMTRGFQKVKDKLPDMNDQDLGNILKTTGMTLISSVGGASGPLYGTFFMRAGMALTAKQELDAQDVIKMIEEGVNGLVARGRAELGDKTMVDAWIPALDALRASLDSNPDMILALRCCVKAAREGMEGTIPMQAKKGRASYLGERSIGHQDPGATSTFLILNALCSVVCDGV